MNEPFDPEQFRDRPDEYMAWAEKNVKFNPYFCPRHWMPCPVEGKPGLVASVILMTESIAFMPDGVTNSHDFPSAANSWMANQTVSICCKLGDEKIAWLWRIIDSDKLCRAFPRQRGQRVCWRVKGHLGEHEWERPFPRSVFDLMGEVNP